MSIPVLSGVLDGAEWWQRNVLEDKIVGPLYRSMAEAQLRNAPYKAEHPLLIDLSPSSPEHVQFLQELAGAKSGTQAADVAFRDNPWGRLLVTSAADPLNLVGVGIPGKLAEALPRLRPVSVGLVQDPEACAPGQAVAAAAGVEGAEIRESEQRVTGDVNGGRHRWVTSGVDHPTCEAAQHYSPGH